MEPLDKGHLGISVSVLHMEVSLIWRLFNTQLYCIGTKTSVLTNLLWKYPLYNVCMESVSSVTIKTNWSKIKDTWILPYYSTVLKFICVLMTSKERDIPIERTLQPSQCILYEAVLSYLTASVPSYYYTKISIIYVFNDLSNTIHHIQWSVISWS